MVYRSEKCRLFQFINQFVGFVVSGSNSHGNKKRKRKLQKTFILCNLERLHSEYFLYGFNSTLKSSMATILQILPQTEHMHDIIACLMYAYLNKTGLYIHYIALFHTVLTQQYHSNTYHIVLTHMISVVSFRIVLYHSN